MNFLGSLLRHITGICAVARAVAGLATATEIPAPLPPEPSGLSPFVFRSWKVEDGLPHNSITAMVQTRDGYIWLGTAYGLARFDGVRFTTFGLRQGLQNLTIATLLEDRQGAIWIGTPGGLSRLHEGQFANWTQRDGLPGNNITALAEDAAGDIWVGTTRGLGRWRQGRFSPIQLPGARKNVYIRALAIDREATLWVATLDAGLFQLKAGQLEAVKGPAGALRVDAYCLSLDSQGRLWVGLSSWLKPEGNRLLCLEGGTWRFFGPQQGLPQQFLTCLVAANDGTLWAGSLDEGLFWQNENNFAGLHRAHGLSDEAITALLVDKDQNLWVGTRAGGLQRLAQRRVQVHRILDDGNECLPQAITQTADGRFWVGTSLRGLFEWQGNTFEQFPREPPASGFKEIETVLASRDGGLWWGAGPALFQWKSNRLSVAYDRPRWLRGDRVVSLFEDRDQTLWIGTLNGQLHSLRNGTLTAFTNALGNGPLKAIAQTPDGTLWAGSLGGGLNRIQNGTNTTLTLKDGLASTLIQTLFVDSGGTLWIGTLGGGLSRWNGHRVETFTLEHGLADSSVVQILEDNAGFLWLGSNRGLMRVERKRLDDLAAGKVARLHPWVFDRFDGMLSEQCMAVSPACLKASDGRLCFSTARGVVVVNPNQTMLEASPPVVLIEALFADGVPFGKQSTPSASDAATTRVPPGTGLLTFHYTGLSFAAPDKVRFRCQIEGLDKDWIEAGDARVANYNHVPPGNYRFRVIACNRDGRWNETGAALAFVVLPYFWQTWWFTGLMVLGSCAVLAGGIRLAERRRYHRRLRQLEMERAMERERSRIARDMHDELGARLTQVSLLCALTGNRAGNTTDVQANCAKISVAARQMTQSLDEIVWAVRPQNDNLESLVEYLGQSTRDLCEGCPVRCWFDMPAGVPPLAVTANTRHNLILACREAVNNVVKHARATELQMRVRLDSGGLLISIRDNGYGFDIARGEAKRSGLLNMRQRMIECGGGCEIESSHGQGTHIQFRLPLAGAVHWETKPDPSP